MGLLDLSAEEGTRRVALSYLEQVFAACDRLEGAEGESEGDNALHDFRVGVRRLRSCLRAYESVFGDDVPRRLLRGLKALAQATNPGRDAEVQREWVQRLGIDAPEAERAGVEWLTAALSRDMDEAYGAVREEVTPRFRKLGRRLRRALRTYTVTFEVGAGDPRARFADVCADAIEQQLERLVGDLRQVRSMEDEAIAHAARIHGKRLRYLIEPLRGAAQGGELEGARGVVRRLKVLQDLLGDLNDLHNLRQTAGQAIEDTAVARARELRAAAEEGGVESALQEDERAGLLGVLARVAKGRSVRFESLLDGWLAEGGELAELERSVRALTATMRGERDVEIERKYLLRGVPPSCRAHPVTEMDQGYLPGRRLIERVRRTRKPTGETLVRTVKVGEGMRRVELEEACSPDVFGALWPLTQGRRVRKRRYAVPHEGLVWEIDEFLDRDLVLAEVELPREDTEITIPEWLAPVLVRDVTDEPAYLNMHLAR